MSTHERCDFCGELGHNWDIHPEAVADVANWKSELLAMEFPFGDHH